MDTKTPLTSSSFSNENLTPSNTHNNTATTISTIPSNETTDKQHSTTKYNPKPSPASQIRMNSMPSKPQATAVETPSGVKHQALKKSRKSMNPYTNISSYSHEATTVPPYALYGIANSHFVFEDPTLSSSPLPSPEKNPHYIVGHYTTKHDPFIHSLNDNWTNFFNAVDSTPAYALEQMKKDPKALMQLPDLSGEWGGGERLKKCLNDEDQTLSDSSTAAASYDNQIRTGKSWYQFFQKKGNGGSGGINNVIGKRESNNGYWMKTSDEHHKRKTRFERMFFYNNYVPLILRLLIIFVSIAALVLAVKIFEHSRKELVRTTVTDTVGNVEQQPSTIMAIVVQSCALMYLLYISYDEFNSQPIGIRNPIDKIRLVLLDLLFILFGSANLSISFNTLYDPRWVCSNRLDSKYALRIASLCDLQKALAGCLFIVLFLWCCNLFISIMRIIHRVTDLADKNTDG